MIYSMTYMCNSSSFNPAFNGCTDEVYVPTADNGAFTVGRFLRIESTSFRLLKEG